MRTIFCCVTPCLNAEHEIGITVKSVLSQALNNKKITLNYVIQDGGSTDNTVRNAVEIINEYKHQSNINIEVVSEKDFGIYDGISKAFMGMPGGHIYSYLNAGDYYSPNAFEIVDEIFLNKEISFLTGLNCSYNEKNHLVGCSLPFTYNKNLILKGFYGNSLPHIQQESTFWSHPLHDKIDFNKLKTIKLAGDYFLWKTFINNDASLHIVNAWLSGFKTHSGQLSAKFSDEYRNEINSLSTASTFYDYVVAYLYKFILLFPDDIRRHLSKTVFRYNHVKQSYCLSKYSS